MCWNVDLLLPSLKVFIHWSRYLWFDKKGNFHVVYHVYCLDPFEAHNECNAGHAFSTDGYTWHFGQDEPYSGLVSFSDGTNTTFSTRERPHMIFAVSTHASQPV